MQSNHKLHLIIAGLAILILIAIIYYNSRINSIVEKQSQQKIEYIKELTPVVDNIKDSMVVTLDAIRKSEEQIKILKTEMRDMQVDTIGLQDAIRLIKDRKNDKDNINVIPVVE